MLLTRMAWRHGHVACSALSAHIDFSALRLLLLLAPLLLLLFLAPFAAASFDLLLARPGLEPGTRREVASPRSIKRHPLPGAWVYPHNDIPGHTRDLTEALMS